MTHHQTMILYSGSIERPPCSKCGAPTMLARVQPDKPDHDTRTFECTKCGHSESMIVKYD